VLSRVTLSNCERPVSLLSIWNLSPRAGTAENGEANVNVCVAPA
jgi:hypothetical protein